MDYSVRRATSSDSAAVRALLRDFSRHLPLTGLLLREDLDVADVDQEGALCFLAREIAGGRPVGLCVASRSYYCGSGPMLMVGALYVDPGHRRRGLSGAMLRHLLGACGEAVRLDMEVPEAALEARAAAAALGLEDIAASHAMANFSLPQSAYQRLLTRPLRAGIGVAPCDEPHDFLLRPAAAADLEFVFGAVKELEEQHGFGVVADGGAFAREWRDGWFSCVVADDVRRARAAGFCLTAPVFSVSHGRTCRISDVVVEPRYRGAGLGSALIRASCRLAQSRGEVVDLQAALWNAAAVSIYEHLGFVREPVVPFAAEMEALQRLRARGVKVGIRLD